MSFGKDRETLPVTRSKHFVRRKRGLHIKKIREILTIK